MATPGSPDYQWSVKPLIPFSPGFPAFDDVQQATLAAASGGAIMQSPGTLTGAATGTVTIAGTTGSGPTVTVTIAGTGVLYTYVAGDTTTTIAAGHIAAAINANSTVNQIVSATSTTNVITLTALTSGQAGMVSLATSVTGGATATASFTELDLPNGWVIPLSTFAFPVQFGLETFFQNIPYQVDNATKTAMRNAGLIQ